MYVCVYVHAYAREECVALCVRFYLSVFVCVCVRGLSHVCVCVCVYCYLALPGVPHDQSSGQYLPVFSLHVV